MWGCLTRRISGALKKVLKVCFLRRLYRQLWRGDTAGALEVLEAERPAAKNEAKLDELITYLQARAAWIPNSREHRIERKYIGTAHIVRDHIRALISTVRFRSCQARRACFTIIIDVRHSSSMRRMDFSHHASTDVAFVGKSELISFGSHYRHASSF